MEENISAPTNSEGIIRHGNISIILDSFDDIFSDFDPRPYSERILSDDFLNECKNRLRNTADSPERALELRLMLPSKLRNNKDELMVRKRLKQYFEAQYKLNLRKLNEIKRTGILWFIFGSLVMVIITYLSKFTGFIYDFLVILGEPAGWFAFWEGLVKVFIDSKEKESELDFYKRFSGTKVVFEGYSS